MGESGAVLFGQVAHFVLIGGFVGVIAQQSSRDGLAPVARLGCSILVGRVPDGKM